VFFNSLQKSDLELPVGNMLHCIVELNSTTLMMIGGTLEGPASSYSPKTFIRNSENNQGWIEGPPLKAARTG
jgi:hypothetical protein